MKMKYSYIMMDRQQFEHYEKQCKRDGLPCNYNMINSDCYGVMIRSEIDDEDEVVEMKKKN